MSVKPASREDPAGRRRVRLAPDMDLSVRAHLDRDQMAALLSRMALASLTTAGSLEEIFSSRPELAGRGLEDLFLALTASA